MYKKNGFAHPILLFLLVLSLLAGTFIVYKKATTSNFRSMGDPQSQVAGTSTTPIPFILQNSMFKLPATSSDEISKGWVFNKGYFGQASATMVRVKDSSIAKAEAIRIAVTTKPQFRHPSLLQRNVPISPSTEYTLSFVAKASAPIQVQMAIRDMSTTNKALAPIPSFAVNGDWTKYETKITTLAFEPSKRANVGLLLNMPNNSTLILDNIFIRPSSPLIDLDRDDDGVFDDEDECPDTPKGSNPDSSRPGCPLEQMPDRDNDQISDDLDICPDTPKGNIPDPARLGCPLEDEDEDNIDADGDSIPDTADLCPFTHKGDNPDPNRLGCPRVDTSKKTKRWYPGHYLDVNSVGDIRAMSDNQYRNFKGARAKITWSELEGPNKGNYHFDIIEDMMNALPAGKKFFIMVEDRTFRNNCHTEIPAYLRNPQNTFISDKNNCSVKIWEPGAMGHVIDLYKAIGDRFDNDARFMGIMNQETANPQLPTAQHDDLAFNLLDFILK